MISKYIDFEVHLFTHDQKLLVDINGRPSAINLPQPIELPITAGRSHLNSGTATGSWVRSMQLTLARVINALYKPFKKVDRIALPGNVASFNFRKVLTLPPQEVARMGHTLYSSVFVNEVASRFQAYLNRREAQEGVRVCICAQSDILSDAAWEILCSALEPIMAFLSLDPKTPVIRSPRIGREVYLREIGQPLRLLVILSSPRFVRSIDPSVEKRIWEQALDPLRATGRVKVDFLGFNSREEANFDKLQEFLLVNDPYDIVHIIGHGLLEASNEGVLALVEPQDGRQHLSRASSIANLFQSRRVMLVVLQSCQSGKIDAPGSYFAGVAQHLVATGIPAVLAMQEVIDQDVARYFIEKFYTSWLKYECPLEDAITQARQSVYDRFATRLASWAIPVLYICPGVQLIIHGSYFRKRPEATTPRSIASYIESVRQVDAALPQETRLNKQTELVTLIRTPTSPGLQEILNAKAQQFVVRPEDVRTSQSFTVSFSVDEETQKVLPKNVRLIIETSDFDIISSEKNVQIRPEGDSVLSWFLITPRREGEARVLVRVVDDTDGQITLTELSLKSNVRSGEAFETPYGIVGTSQAAEQKRIDSDTSSDELRLQRPAPAQESSSRRWSQENLSRLRDLSTYFTELVISLHRLEDVDRQRLEDIDRSVADIAEAAEATYITVGEIIDLSLSKDYARYDIPNSREEMQAILRVCSRIVERCGDLHAYIEKAQPEWQRDHTRKELTNYVRNELYILTREVEDLKNLLQE